MLTVISMVLALASQDPASATTQIQSGAPGSAPAPEAIAETPVQTTASAPQARPRQRHIVCGRQAPTGSRLNRNRCELRETAEAEARTARETHEAVIQNGAWTREH